MRHIRRNARWLLRPTRAYAGCTLRELVIAPYALTRVKNRTSGGVGGVTDTIRYPDPIGGWALRRLSYTRQFAGRYLAIKVPPVQFQVTSLLLAERVGVIIMVPPPAVAV